MKNRTRREFFKQLTYSGVAAAFLPAILSSCRDPFLSSDKNCVDLDGILPITFIGDCADLILQLSSISEKGRTALRADINLNIPGNMSRLAPALLFQDETILELLNHTKHEWDSGTGDSTTEQKYALYMGWIIYSDFREATGKLYHRLIDNGYHYDDIRVCHDAFIIRQLSDNTGIDPGITPDILEEFLNLMLPRMITRLHTFKPDATDGKKWVNDMTGWRKANKDLIRKYAEEIIHPNQDYIDKFILKPGFYEPLDDIIQLARKIRKGVNVPENDILNTLKSDSGNSIYAKSLVNGIEKAKLTDLFTTGELGFSEFSHQIART